MKNKIIGLVLTILMAAAIPLSLSACSPKENKVIKINEVTHSVFYAPLYLASALGYFEEEGFAIELTNGGGADSTMAAVLSGAADVGFCGPEAVVYVALGGSEDSPKVFAQLTKRDGSFLLGRKAEPNFDWNNLSGKEILAGRKGGVPAMTFEYVLKEKNITSTLNYDVAFNMMTAAFESGIAEYCTMFEPAASEFVAQGKGHIVASVGEASGEIPYTCFMAKESYINSNADKIEGLTRGVTKAVKYINENSSKVVAEKIASFFDGTSLSALETSINSYKSIDAWVTNMAMKESSLNRLLDVIESAGELSSRVAFDKVCVTQTAQKVYSEVYA